MIAKGSGGSECGAAHAFVLVSWTLGIGAIQGDIVLEKGTN